MKTQPLCESNNTERVVLNTVDLYALRIGPLVQSAPEFLCVPGTLPLSFHMHFYDKASDGFRLREQSLYLGYVFKAICVVSGQYIEIIRI